MKEGMEVEWKHPFCKQASQKKQARSHFQHLEVMPKFIQPDMFHGKSPENQSRQRVITYEVSLWTTWLAWFTKQSWELSNSLPCLSKEGKINGSQSFCLEKHRQSQLHWNTRDISSPDEQNQRRAHETVTFYRPFHKVRGGSTVHNRRIKCSSHGTTKLNPRVHPTWYPFNLVV